MKYIVVKEFAAGNSRFSAGQEIADTDVTGPVPASRFIELGYLTEKPEPRAELAQEEVPAVAVDVPAGSAAVTEPPPARRPRKAGADAPA